MKRVVCLLAITGVVLSTGCGKKEASTPPPASRQTKAVKPAEDDTDAAATPGTMPGAAPAPAATEPAAIVQAPAGVTGFSVADAEKQLQQKDFEGATRTLVQIQYQNQGNEKAGVDTANRMRQMQIKLAEELMRNPGNTNAQQAAGILQQIYGGQRQAPH